MATAATATATQAPLGSDDHPYLEKMAKGVEPWLSNVRLTVVRSLDVSGMDRLSPELVGLFPAVGKADSDDDWSSTIPR